MDTMRDRMKYDTPGNFAPVREDYRGIPDFPWMVAPSNMHRGSVLMLLVVGTISWPVRGINIECMVDQVLSKWVRKIKDKI